MDRLKMISPDNIMSHIEQIGTLFPSCLTEITGANGQIT